MSTASENPDPTAGLVVLDDGSAALGEERWTLSATETTEVTAETEGTWLVETMGTRHVWDLDRRRYLRSPGPETHADPMPHDNTFVPITRIDAYPTIGQSSFVWFDDPDDGHPGGTEHYRRSSTVRRIRRLLPATPSRTSADERQETVGDLSPTSGEAPGENELATLLGPFWSASHVAHALALPDIEAVHEWVKDGQLLALPTSDGEHVFPVSQFSSTSGCVEVHPHLLPIMEALRLHDPWSVALLMVTPAAELGGRTPVDCDVRDLAALRDLARQIDREWSSS